MKETRALMGMPITVEIVDQHATSRDLDSAYEYFDYIDKKFSPYKASSEVSKINSHSLKPAEYSPDLQTVLDLCEKARVETGGYFDIQYQGKIDPSGLVKGWAIYNASKLLKDKGFTNFYIEAGGDIEAIGKNLKEKGWSVGIRNPFNKAEIIKVLLISNCGLATSGTYERGQHIYNPLTGVKEINDIISLTVIGPNVYEADRFATAAFAMGKKGIEFIEKRPGLEGYMIDTSGIATMTSSFNQFVEVKKDA